MYRHLRTLSSTALLVIGLAACAPYTQHRGGYPGGYAGGYPGGYAGGYSASPYGQPSYSTSICSEPSGVKEFFGTLGGAGLGGWAGSQVGSGTGKLAAVGAGTLLGAFLGSGIGASLDKADACYMEQATQAAYSAPIGQPIEWSNPQSGRYGAVVATREGYTTITREYCREFQSTITVGGRAQRGFGQACQQPDGSWRIVN